MATAKSLVRGGRPGGVVLFDEHGQAFNASATMAAWKGSTDNRRTRGWGATGASVNSLLATEVSQLRTRTRDLLRKNPWAANGMETFVSNIVGNGLVPRLQLKDAKRKRAVMDLWEEFTENCDADGVQSFYGQQAQVAHAFKEGGDCFGRFRPRRANELTIPVQIQILEAEFVDPSLNEILAYGGRVQAGIEFDVLGRRTAYHMFREHPGDMLAFRNSERVRVPSESVMHVFHATRPGQIRGVPVLAAVLAKLWELEKYDDAEVMRKQVSAMFAGFLRKPDLNSNPLGGGQQEGRDPDGTPLASLEPGTIQMLGPGEEITFSEPADVGSSYAPFMTFQLRQVAAAIGVTYEQLTGDLSGVNYSSIRAGLVEMRRRFSQLQRNVLVFQFCRPVWKRFIETAVLANRIPVPADFRELLRVQWVMTPGWEYVDPEREINATIKKIRSGLSTRGREVTALGTDVEDIDEETSLENERTDRLQLTYDTDPRRVSAQGQEHSGRGSATGVDDEDEDEDELDDEPDEELDDEDDEDADELAEKRERRGARVHAKPAKAAKAKAKGTSRKRTYRRAADADARRDTGADLPSSPRARKRSTAAASGVRRVRGTKEKPSGRGRDRSSSRRR
jgi:lambda family phage portal protein